jgi:hypothetical protein
MLKIKNRHYKSFHFLFNLEPKASTKMSVALDEMNLRGVVAYACRGEKARGVLLFDAPRATHQHKIAPLAHCSSSDARWSFYNSRAARPRILSV